MLLTELAATADRAAQARGCAPEVVVQELLDMAVLLERMKGNTIGHNVAFAREASAVGQPVTLILNVPAGRSGYGEVNIATDLAMLSRLLK